jgi:Type II secretion system (T2SS), protein E, N-terminal domain
MKLFRSITSSAWAMGLTVVRCKGKDCDRWLTLRHISSRKRGVGLGKSWYCSKRCFTPVASEQISDLVMLEPASENRPSRMPLGLILVDKGQLTDEQFRNAIEEQKHMGGEIGELLVRGDLATEKQVTAARAIQWGCPVYVTPRRLAKTKVSIPSELCAEYFMAPLHYGMATNRLLVGFVYGIDYGVLYTIEQMTGSKTQPCFITPKDYEAQVTQGQAGSEGAIVPKEIPVYFAKSPAQMVDIIYTRSEEIEGTEVVFARCKNHLWARIRAGVNTTDLLFNVA